MLGGYQQLTALRPTAPLLRGYPHLHTLMAGELFPASKTVHDRSRFGQERKEKAMIKEFKEFALKGNLVDLATAFILGAAFGRLVTSFVSDILMPPIGLVLGKVDFSNLFVNLTRTPYKSLAEAQAAGAPTLNYGLFINSVIDFLIVAFALFLVIKQVNRLARPAPVLATKDCPFCLSKIPEAATRCPACTSELTS